MSSHSVNQGLGFLLYVYHPKPVAQVVLEEFRAWKIAQLPSDSTGATEAEIEVKRTWDTFSEQILLFLLDDVMTTYLPLAETPAEIALGALLHNCEWPFIFDLDLLMHLYDPTATPSLEIERFIAETLDAHAMPAATDTALQRAERIKLELQMVGIARYWTMCPLPFPPSFSVHQVCADQPTREMFRCCNLSTKSVPHACSSNCEKQPFGINRKNGNQKHCDSSFRLLSAMLTCGTPPTLSSAFSLED